MSRSILSRPRTRRPRRRALWPSTAPLPAAVLGALAVGCADGSRPPDAGAPAAVPADLASHPLIEVGGGRQAFVDLVAGGKVPIERGPQLGHHIWIAVRGRGLDPDGMLIDYGVRDAESDATVSEDPLRHWSRPRPAADWYIWSGLAAPLAVPVAEVAGRPVILWARATDRAGRTALDQSEAVTAVLSDATPAPDGGFSGEMPSDAMPAPDGGSGGAVTSDAMPAPDGGSGGAVTSDAMPASGGDR